MSRRIAIVLAGGVGSRVGLDIPKQLIKVAGHSILEHVLLRLDAHPDVEEIVVMMARGHLDAVHEIARKGDYAKITHVLEGAETRNGTTRKALEAIDDDDAMLLIHDAVRPLVSPRIISECFEALTRHDAIDVAIASTDTIIEVDDEGFVTAIPERASLRRGQTPQAFRAGVLRSAYDAAGQDPGFTATDDCSVVLRYRPDVPIRVVDGEERNLKVTDPIDVYLADKLFQLSHEGLHAELSDEEHRSRLEGRTVVVMGGSYGIGADIAAYAERHGARVFAFSRSATGTHVERRDDIRAAIDTVLAQVETIDYVVNTAGVLPRSELAETSDETIWAATEVNYVAPILMAQEFLPHLRASRGSLLFFTSSSYTRGRAGYSLYSSAKAAVVNLTQALADEWSSLGVRVNCVNPERTGTPMRTQAFGEEPPGSLLESAQVARKSVEVMISGETGLLIDVRREDPLAPRAPFPDDEVEP